MKTVLAILAVLGYASAAPGGEGGWGNKNGGGWGSSLSTSCYETSTCKAVYSTQTNVYTKPVYVTATSTVYKPETLTTQKPTVVYETSYVTKVVTVTSTSKVKVPTSKVVCSTYSTWYYSESLCPEASTSVQTVPYSETKEVPSTYVTSSPCPEVYTSTGSKLETAYSTVSSSQCWPEQICSTMTVASKGWGHGGGW